jgi:hypothetical protein
VGGWLVVGRAECRGFTLKKRSRANKKHKKRSAMDMFDQIQPIFGYFWLFFGVYSVSSISQNRPIFGGLHRVGLASTLWIIVVGVVKA